MKKQNKNIADKIHVELIDCNDECPEDHIKVEVRDPTTGELLGCRCVPSHPDAKKSNN